MNQRQHFWGKQRTNTDLHLGTNSHKIPTLTCKLAVHEWQHSSQQWAAYTHALLHLRIHTTAESLHPPATLPCMNGSTSRVGSMQTHTPIYAHTTAEFLHSPANLPCMNSSTSRVGSILTHSYIYAHTNAKFLTFTHTQLQNPYTHLQTYRAWMAAF